MAQTFEGLRVSSPETIYARLDKPTNPSADIAVVGLGRLFDIYPRGTNPSFDQYAKEAISDAMIGDPSGITLPEIRPVEVNAKNVFELAIKYPWLRKLSYSSSRLETMFEKEFWGMFQGHTVDDYPGLFGVTLREAKILRAVAHEQGYDLTGLAREAGLYDQEAFK